MKGQIPSQLTGQYQINMDTNEQFTNAVKWLERLPKERQCFNAYKTKRVILGVFPAHSYCAIGVAQKVAGRMDVEEAVGLTDDGSAAVIHMNDTDRISLRSIATKVKTNPHAYFRKGVADSLDQHYNKN